MEVYLVFCDVVRGTDIFIDVFATKEAAEAFLERAYEARQVGDDYKGSGCVFYISNAQVRDK